MSLGKVKSFLIVLFLGINIFLLISAELSSEFRIDDRTIENTITVLNSSNISIDKSVIPKKTENLKNIDTRNIVYTENFKESEYYDLFEINGDRFFCEISDSGIYNQSNKKIRSKIKSFLSGAGFDTGYMKFSGISEKDGIKTLKIKCNVSGYTIFDSAITAKIYSGGFSLRGVWYEPQTSAVKSNTRVRQNVYITSILINLANSGLADSAPFAVKGIELGYMSGLLYGRSGHLTATALPYYKITDDKGRIYYFDASNGEYYHMN